MILQCTYACGGGGSGGVLPLPLPLLPQPPSSSVAATAAAVAVAATATVAAAAAAAGGGGEGVSSVTLHLTPLRQGLSQKLESPLFLGRLVTPSCLYHTSTGVRQRSLLGN